MMVRDRESGQATVFIALFMGLVMLGFLGFALDVGYFFHEKRMAQAAADAAAVAYAEEDGYGNGHTVALTAAEAAAKQNGFDTTLATNPAVVTPAWPTTGNYSNANSSPVPNTWIQIEVSKPIPAFFLSAFNHGSTTMTVSAVGIATEGVASPTCVCLEGSSGMDLNMSNNSKLNVSSCGVTADSSSSNAVGIVGSAMLTAGTLGMVSTSWTQSANVNNGGSIASGTKIVQGISTSCSPSMPTAPVDSTCSADPYTKLSGGGVPYTVGPNSTYGTTLNGNMVCYTALTVAGNGDTATLNAGIYVINGGELHFQSGTQFGGNGVFFYLEGNANLVIDNGANVNLVAPTSGTYSGILLYQAASDTQALSVQGGSSAVINGSIYAPGASITLGNGSGTTVNADIVAQALTMNGGGTLNNVSNTQGTQNTSVAKLAE